MTTMLSEINRCCETSEYYMTAYCCDISQYCNVIRVNAVRHNQQEMEKMLASQMIISEYHNNKPCAYYRHCIYYLYNSNLAPNMDSVAVRRQNIMRHPLDYFDDLNKLWA